MSDDTLEIPAPPALAFRALHQQLHAFASHTMHDDDVQHYTTSLQHHERELLAALEWPAPQASERTALQANKVKVAGKSIDVSAVIQQEIFKLSDEFHVSEARCFEFWYLASDQQRREWIERVDQLPAESIASSIPAAARHFLISETEYKLNLIKELLRLRFDDRLDAKRRQFVISYTNKLLSNELLTKLVAAYDEQLPKLLQITHVEQSVSYWHCLIADAIVFIVSSCRVTPQEVQKIAELLKSLCGRLNAVVAKVSPHIVNLSSFSQLFERGSLAGTSPEGVVKQVSCMLQAMTTVQVALFNVLLQKNEKMDRETGDTVSGNVLDGSEHATVVRELHKIFYEQEWEHASFQSVAMLAWAGFLGSVGENSSSSRSAGAGMFAEVEQGPNVVKKAIEERVFTTMVNILLKYFPDAKQDPLLYHIYERSFELLFVNYSTNLMIDVPTLADQAALSAMQSESNGDVAAWNGDCLENIIEFATTLCTRDVTFSTSFWRPEDISHGEHDNDSVNNDNDNNGNSGSCNAFLVACRDAAFKNPACFVAYMRLVAAAASGPDCAQLAFHHVKQNPSILNWEHFFAVMAKYQRLLTDAEKPASGFLPGMPGGVIDNSSLRNNNTPGPRFIRPKELEALEMIQLVIQAVIRDPQLALIFFHNHDWSPIPTFVAFLQCRIPSSLKGALMKTLAIFARVPEISPFVWRHVDALQILRTTGDTSGYGNQDISYELEHYESMSRMYPATRGFVTLLYELFENPHAWNSFEGDGRVAAIQYYFEYLLERVFLKFDLRKYEQEEEKWALVNGALAIFKKILRNVGSSTAEGSLAHQILARVLSGSPLLEKILLILSSDGGVESLENASTDVHLEHAFFYCLEIAKKKTEATHGSLIYSSDSVSKRRDGSQLTKSSAVGVLRERCVQHALEIVVLVLEKDTTFVNADLNRQLSHRLQVEMLHTILSRYRADFVNIVQYIKYTKSSHIPHLSAVVLRMISNRMSGVDLVDLLIDSRSSSDIVLGYMNRLLNDYDDSRDVENDGSEAGSDEPDLESTSFVTISSAKKRKRHESSILSPYELLPQESAPPSIRATILDLFLENLRKPSPNVAHLLLGILDRRGEYVKSGLDAVITLVSSADFGLEYPELAERCYKVIYYLVTQDFSSSFVVGILENASYDYFATQIELFRNVYRVRRRRSSSDAIAELNMRGWFFKTLAMYLHVCLHKEPPHMKKTNRLMGLLLSAEEHGYSKQDQMLLLQFVDETSFHISPPDVPNHQQVVSLAEQVTLSVDDGYYKWLKIDIERFCQALQSLDLNAVGSIDYFTSNSFKRFRSSQNGNLMPSGSSAVDQFIQWAVQWNIYSERVAAESHALNSLRELIEIVVLDYLTLPNVQDAETPAMWQGLDAVASREVRLELMGGIVSAVLNKLTDSASVSAQLFEIVARIALLLFSQLRQPGDSANGGVHESRYRQNLAFLELVFRAICSSGHATGNPSAARNSRTLLYSCVVNVLHALPPPFSELKAAPRVRMTAGIGGQRLSFLTSQAVDLICRDASDGDDPLSMALAISALEAIVSFEDGGASSSSSSTLITIFRERGYLLHFIGIFRTLCDIDASLDRGASFEDVTKTTRALPAGIDAATVGTMYECFLSLFAKVADSKDGAVALVEGGLVRVLSEARNLPTHRPKFLRSNESSSSSVSRATSVAFQRAEAAYYRKWLPIVRLVSALCASLPQNRTVAAQVLHLVNKNRKLFTAVLKIDNRFGPVPSSLNLLRELSYVTFIFRYVTQFVDLCETTLTAVKWEKIAHAIVQVFMFFMTEVVPPAAEDNENAMSDKDPRGVWWLQTVPRNAMEQRDDAIRRFACAECAQTLAERCGGVNAAGVLVQLSLFEEEKLYASRMIVCNTVAFCANRMMKSVDETNAGGILAGKTPLLAVSHKNGAQNGSSYFPPLASFDQRSTLASSDPLLTHAPSMNDFVERFETAVDAFESSKQLLQALAASSNNNNNDLMMRRRRPEHQCNTSHVTSVVEYHGDSMGFVVENMVVVLLLHFVHFLSNAETAKSSVVQHTLAKVLAIIREIESNSFVHALARKLRDVASAKLE